LFDVKLYGIKEVTMTERNALEKIRQQWRTERPDLDPTCMVVCGAIWRAGKRLNDGLKTNLDAYGLDFPAMDVLLTLRRNGIEAPMSPKNMAADMMLSTAAMTARLDRLEARNLIARLPNPADRRALLIALTVPGVALIADMIDRHIAAERAMLSTLSAEEQEIIIALLSRVAMTK
jgi:DNA-binding MarR family transcriptional regulator